MSFFAQLLALLAPPACAACRAPTPAGADLLCAACRRALPWLSGPRCARCGLPSPCRPCPARGAAFDQAWAPMAHEGPARELVVALKFRGALPAAEAMAAAMAAQVPAALLAGASLVPVPLHPSRRRKRGFDQAARLASALARRTSTPLDACLRRSGPATRQLGAGRARRLSSDRLVVTVRGHAPAQAVLVDDVHTTGATFEACARALREGGAQQVSCLAYARTLRR
ncbi:MAG: ComF family protein [Solirubrobacteraceae bacterium]